MAERAFFVWQLCNWRCHSLDNGDKITFRVFLSNPSRKSSAKLLSMPQHALTINFIKTSSLLNDARKKFYQIRKHFSRQATRKVRSFENRIACSRNKMERKDVNSLDKASVLLWMNKRLGQTTFDGIQGSTSFIWTELYFRSELNASLSPAQRHRSESTADSDDSLRLQ